MIKLITASLAAMFMSFGATAQTTFFTDTISFESAATNLVLDTFSTAVQPGGANTPISFETGMVTTDGFLGTFIAASDGIGIDTGNPGSQTTFTFDTAITAFGISIFAFDGDDFAISLNLSTSSGASSDLFVDVSDTLETQLFTGVTSSSPFTSVTFNSVSASDAIQFDNLLTGQAISAIPEPATWLMMIVGFAVTAFAFRGRQRHQGAIS